MTNGKRRRGARFAFTALVLTIPLATFLAIGGTFLIVADTISEPDAVVVLASHEWERLPEAARLARRDPRVTVLLTQPVRPNIHNCFRCAERVQWLQTLGVPAKAIVLLPRRVTNTFDEAVTARDYAVSHRLKRLVVVTSPYHTRRARATFTSVFERTGIELGVWPDMRESMSRPRTWWWHGYDRWYVAYEWSAIVWYAIRHGIVSVG